MGHALGFETIIECQTQKPFRLLSIHSMPTMRLQGRSSLSPTSVAVVWRHVRGVRLSPAMEYNDRLLDFMVRTRENLTLIEAWRSEHPDAAFHEVTQLINSLLGLVIVPKELAHVLGDISEAPVSRSGIPRWNLSFRLDGETPPLNLHDLLIGLRNAVAHYALQYVADDHQDIASVIFQVTPWGSKGKPAPPPWQATFTISQLRLFLRQLVDEVIRVHGPLVSSASAEVILD